MLYQDTGWVVVPQIPCTHSCVRVCVRACVCLCVCVCACVCASVHPSSRPLARMPARPHARTPARPHARTPARPHALDMIVQAKPGISQCLFHPTIPARCRTSSIVSNNVHRPSYHPHLSSHEKELLFSLQNPCPRSLHRDWLDHFAVDLDLYLA